MRRIFTRLADERGSGTIIAAGLIGVMAVMCSAILVVGSALAARTRAQSAADFAALAAAQTLIAGHGEAMACSQAAAVAHANAADLTGCATDTENRVTIKVTATPAFASQRFGPISTPARATAQAGPANGDGS